MCKYCNPESFDGEFTFPYVQYSGDKFQPLKNINKENIEVYITDNVDEDCWTLDINGDYTDIQIEILFCPMCGRKL